MSARALVIGVDDYVNDPLTSAVNDAEAFRQTLLDLELAGEDEITLLTTADGADGRADFATIKNAIKHLYRDCGEIERLFFFFAGHGILAFRDAASTEAVTALLPVDVESLSDDGGSLLVLDEVLSYLKLAGPREQFYFVDACRDMPYEQSPPKLGTLGFDGQPPQAPRSQSVLYAVSELGKARGSRDGSGAMTSHVTDALQARGRALDYSYDDLAYVVTIESIRNYVCARLVPAASEDDPLALSVLQPSLDRRGPEPKPLRVVEDPPPRELTVHIEPDQAAPETEVEVGFGAGPATYSWPPSANHQQMQVPPRRFVLSASSRAGWVDPSYRSLDAREEEEAIVRVHSGPAGDGDGPRVDVSKPPEVPLDRAALIRGELSGGLKAADAPPPEGWLSVDTMEPVFAIDVIGLEPPYAHSTGFGKVARGVAAGTYRIDFRLGPDVLFSTDVFVPDGAEVEVAPPAYLREGLHGSSIAPPPLVLQRFARDLARDISGGADYNVALLVALEGGHRGASAAAAEIERMQASTVGLDGTMQTGFEVMRMSGSVIGMTRVRLPEDPFELRLEGPGIGDLRFASVALEGCSTIATVRIGTGGDVDVSQNLVPPFRVAATLRIHQLGQQLYKSDELLAAPGVAAAIARASRDSVDPVLACMLIYAANAAPKRLGAVAPSKLDWAHDALADRFGALPDASIAASLFRRDTRADLLEPLLEAEVEPLLSRSAAELAAYALETGRDDHPAVQRRRQVSPGQVWNLMWSQPGGAQKAEPTGTKALQ